MAGLATSYYRNHSLSDTTTVTYTANDGYDFVVKTIDAIGWSAPEGYTFKEWNETSNGTGTTYAPGDLRSPEVLYAIWEEEPVATDYLTTDQELTSIANAIRTKGGTSVSLTYPSGFISAIQAISTGTDVSDTTAVAEDVLSGKYFYISNGTKTQGTITTKTSSNLSANGKTVTVPAGYYAQQYTKDVADGTITNNTTLPSGSSSSGTINRGSYIKIGAGYYPDTYYMAQTDNLGTKSITTSDKSHTDISVDGYSNVNISGLSVKENSMFSLMMDNNTSFDASHPIMIRAGNNHYVAYSDASGCITSLSIGSDATGVTSENGSGKFEIIAYVSSGDTSRDTKRTIVENGRWVTTNVSASGTYYGRVVVGSGSATTPATTVTANPSISVNSSTGVITATTSVTQSVTPTVSAGYVSSGTAGTITVSGSNSEALTTLGATTYNTSTSDQTITSGKFLTGTQTIKAVTTSGNITAANIKDGTVVKVGDANNAGRIVNVTGSFTDSSTVSPGQTAASATEIRTGYSAWVDGEEVTGSLGNSSMSEGVTTVSGTTATRGEFTWTAGVTTVGTLEPASFSNSVATGKTADDYVNISSTSEAPVLVSGGYLYINKGYTDNLKISLAKLVPDGASANLAEGHILSGYSAYNNDGTLVAGNIPTKTSSNLSASGKTVTVPAGYYAQQYTKDVADGTITNNTTLPSGSSSSGTINRGSYIKIGAGYHPDTYYQAQANSGTKYITSSDYAKTNIGVNGYANINIDSLTVPSDFGFTLNVANASSQVSEDEVRINVGTYRIVTVIPNSNSRLGISNSYSNGEAWVSHNMDGNGLTKVRAFDVAGGTRTTYQIIVDNGRWVTTNVADAGTFYGRVVVGSGSATTPTTTITANPTISINSSTGVITATASATQSVTPTVSAGYVASGTAGTITISGSNTSSLTTQAAQTITPTTTDQTIASGKYLTGTQTIKGDANLVAGNIKKDVTIFGVTGTHEGGGGVIISDTTDAAGGTVRTITTTSTPVMLQAKTNIDPTSSSQTITPDAGYDGLSSVQINAASGGSTVAIDGKKYLVLTFDMIPSGYEGESVTYSISGTQQELSNIMTNINAESVYGGGIFTDYNSSVYTAFVDRAMCRNNIIALAAIDLSDGAIYYIEYAITINGSSITITVNHRDYSMEDNMDGAIVIPAFISS